MWKIYELVGRKHLFDVGKDYSGGINMCIAKSEMVRDHGEATNKQVQLQIRLNLSLAPLPKLLRNSSSAVFFRLACLF